MIENIKRHIASFLLLVFLVPVAINSIHDFLDHEHTVCTSKIENHIHDKDTDCTLHLLKQGNSFLALEYFEIPTKTIYLENSTYNYHFLKNHYQLSFSLRGPPVFI